MATSSIRAVKARQTETPNVLMTTLASPSQGPTAQLSMWLVDMRAGQQGPPHFFDTEQIWHLLEGDVDIAVEGEHMALSPGDTLILPAGSVRQVSAHTDVRLVVCGHGYAVATVPGEAASRGAVRADACSAGAPASVLHQQLQLLGAAAERFYQCN